MPQPYNRVGNGKRASRSYAASIILNSIAILVALIALILAIIAVGQLTSGYFVVKNVKITGVLDKSMMIEEKAKRRHTFTIVTASFYPPWNNNRLVGGASSYPYQNATSAGWSTGLFKRIADAANFTVNLVVGDYDNVFRPTLDLAPGIELVENFGTINQKPAKMFYHKTQSFVQVDGWDTWYNTTARTDAGFTFTDTYSTGPLVSFITHFDRDTSDLDLFWNSSAIIGYYQMTTGNADCPGLTTEMTTRFPAPIAPALDNANWKSYLNVDLDLAMQDLRTGAITAFLWTSDTMLPENEDNVLVGPASERKFVAQLGDPTTDLPGFSCIEPGVGQALISYPLPESETRIKAFQCYFNLGLQILRANGDMVEFNQFGPLWGGGEDPKAIMTPNTPPNFNCSQYDHLVFD